MIDAVAGLTSENSLKYFCLEGAPPWRAARKSAIAAYGHRDGVGLPARVSDGLTEVSAASAYAAELSNTGYIARA